MNIARAYHVACDAVRHGLDVDFDRFMVAHGDVGNLCQDHDEGGCPTPAGVAAAEAFVARARNWTDTGWKIYAAYQAAKIAKNALVCEYVGHDLADDSYGGPDSGCMAAHCERCGWSFHHTLY